MEDKALQFAKAKLSMLVTLPGMVIEVRPMQSLKELFPMLVTLLGMLIEVRLLQPSKASLAMLVTLLGMVIEARLLQPSNAQFPMLVSPVKYCSSSNEVMLVFQENTRLKSVTAAASASFSSPSPLVSHLATQMLLTLASAKEIFSTMPPLNTSSVHPAAIYASRVPAGTMSVQLSEMP